MQLETVGIALDVQLGSPCADDSLDEIFLYPQVDLLAERVPSVGIVVPHDFQVGPEHAAPFDRYLIEIAWVAQGDVLDGHLGRLRGAELRGRATTREQQGNDAGDVTHNAPRIRKATMPS